jgi:hypothetical protein
VRSQTTQLLVDERKKFFDGFRIAGGHGAEELGGVGHRGDYAGIPHKSQRKRASNSLRNNHEGSIPFTRSIDFRALTRKCK